jgi:alpha-beta hydrolase superfamily lysophospholipase
MVMRRAIGIAAWRAAPGLVALFTALGAVARDPMIGTWEGRWTRGGDSLDVVIEIDPAEAANRYRASFSSERLRVAGIPFASARHDGCCGIHMELRGDETSTHFSGSIQGGELRGTFAEDGRAAGTFELHRVRDPRPAERAEAVTFIDGAVRLAGTLVLPETAPPYPALVMMHGSGAEGRWANRFLAGQLARAGIAVLVYDKRGVGESTGDWHTASFDDLARDAAAAVALLRARPDIRADAIGLYGNSQGATYAPLAVQEMPRVAFVIASAASGVAMDDLERYSVRNALRVTNLPPDDAALARRYVDALVGVAYHGEPRARLDDIARSAAGKAWFMEPPAPGDPYWAFTQRIAAYDPVAHWKGVRVPVLLLYGSADERTPVDPSVRAIRQALERNHRPLPTVCIYLGADHGLRRKEPGDEWPRDAAGYPEDLIRWTQWAARRGHGAGAAPEGLSQSCGRMEMR